MSDELLDVLDEHGNPTGRTATRSEVHAQGLWHRSVHVWIVNSHSEILIQKRSMSKDDHPGEWDGQSGGHLRAGQTPVDGVIRELNEELNIDVTPEQLEFLFEKTGGSVRPGYINREYNPVYLTLLDLPLSAFTFNDGEVTELRWVSLNELEQMVAERTILVHSDEEARVIAAIRERFKTR